MGEKVSRQHPERLHAKRENQLRSDYLQSLNKECQAALHEMLVSRSWEPPSFRSSSVAQAHVKVCEEALLEGYVRP